MGYVVDYGSTEQSFGSLLMRHLVKTADTDILYSRSENNRKFVNVNSIFTLKRTFTQRDSLGVRCNHSYLLSIVLLCYNCVTMYMHNVYIATVILMSI